MKTLTLCSTAEDGEPLKTVFDADRGMNLISYQKGGLEVIAQPAEEGLVGPHFGERLPETLPPTKGGEGALRDPFPYGIGRHAPWQAKLEEGRLEASLSGKGEWRGVSLASLQGRQFEMAMQAELSSSRLGCRYSIVCSADALTGARYCFALPRGGALVRGRVAPGYCDRGEFREVAERWSRQPSGELQFEVPRELHASLRPFPDPLQGRLELDLGEYQLQLRYRCNCEESSWILYRPADADYLALGALSSQNPWRPNLTVSSIEMEMIIKSEV